MRPKWLDAKPSTRERSYKQESRLAKVLKGKTTLNSGATFSENDLFTDYCEVEAKTTSKESFSFKLTDWDKLVRKMKSPTKFPVFAVNFEEAAQEFALVKMTDLIFLINAANKIS